MRYIIFLLLIQSIHGQCLDTHLYSDHFKRTLIDSHVDSFRRVNDYIFYRKGNKLYSYSCNTNESYFIDWNAGDFTLGPDETLAYRKGNSFYIKAPPFSGKSRHITWNVSSYFWTVDGTLIYKKLNSHFILHNKFTDDPQLISSNIESWIKGLYGELAYIKLGNLYYIDNKVKGSTVSVQPNIQKAFFVNDCLYFIKNGDLWFYDTAKNKKGKLLYRVGNYYICGDSLYVNTQKGLYIVQGDEAVFTGHCGINSIQTSCSGISYIYNNRLYFIQGKNTVELCQSPVWSAFSENGCMYLYLNNNLCFIDSEHKVNIILEDICSPSYSNKRIYYRQKNRQYYLEPALGKVFLCK